MEQLSPLGPAYQAGTLSGNPVGMAAGSATLSLCRSPGFYDSLGEKTARLADGLLAAASEAGVALQTGSRGGMFGLAFADRPPRTFAEVQACDHDAFARFFRCMLDRGVWLPPSGYEAMFVSSAHDSEAIDHVLAAAVDSFRQIVS
jgi:glutamate-1-semialdehyde 2,1-aminomutase